MCSCTAYRPHPARPERRTSWPRSSPCRASPSSRRGCSRRAGRVLSPTSSRPTCRWSTRSRRPPRKSRKNASSSSVSRRVAPGSTRREPGRNRSMAQVNGGQVLARCLAAEGIRFVFGLPSPEIDPLLAALEAHGIRLVPIRHEAAGAHMAEGLYKTTGQVAAVIGNPGPGSANLLAGVITARHEGVPMLVVTSQHRLGIVYPASPATFQGQDQLDVYRAAVKWGGPVFEWARIPEVVQLAFREMWTGRPGPVQIELPAPVLYATGDDATVRVPAPTAYRATFPEASGAQIARLVDLLAAAVRPAVVAGSGVDRAGANAALEAVVERLGCPVVPSMAGRSVVPGDHPSCVSGAGPGGDLVKREADVVLVVGSRLGNLDLPYDKYWGAPAPP